MAILEKAARQGHTYAMDAVARIHTGRQEHEQALQWATKVSWCRLTLSNPCRKRLELSAWNWHMMNRFQVCFPTLLSKFPTLLSDKSNLRRYTKAAESGLPQAMFDLGLLLDKGTGVAAPDYPAGRFRLFPHCSRVDGAWFQRLKLRCDVPISNFAFNFNLRC
jgi:hypothetical protein